MIPGEPAGVIPSLSASSLDYQANTHNVHDYVHEMTDFSVIFRFPAYQKTTPGCPGAVAKITSSIHHDVITRGNYTMMVATIIKIVVLILRPGDGSTGVDSSWVSAVIVSTTTESTLADSS